MYIYIVVPRAQDHEIPTILHLVSLKNMTSVGLWTCRRKSADFSLFITMPAVSTKDNITSCTELISQPVYNNGAKIEPDDRFYSGKLFNIEIETSGRNKNKTCQ